MRLIKVFWGRGSLFTSEDRRVCKWKRKDTVLDLVLCWLDSNSFYLWEEECQSSIVYNGDVVGILGR
jgi:hypothetical protein